MKKFAIGDIHGRYDALVEVLRLSKFDYEEDRLFILGDVVDGGHQTFEVVRELLKIKDKVFILGNHDSWFLGFMKKGVAINGWIHQGGINTVNSYLRNNGKDEIKVKPRNINSMALMSKYDKPCFQINEFFMPVTHQEFFNNAKLYHIEKKMCFVHGGFNPYKGVEESNKQEILWDRELYVNSSYQKFDTVKKFEKIFIGHTSTQYLKDNRSANPCKFGNIWMLDTGAGWDGRLTIMNVETEEYWQSELQESER